MSRRCVGLVVGLGVLGLAPPGYAEAPMRVGILAFAVSGGADPGLGVQMANRLGEVLAARPWVTAVTPDDLRALLEQEAQRQRFGCDDESCLSELAGAVGADVVVKGRLTRVNDGFVVSLSAVQPDRAVPIGRVSQRWGGAGGDLLRLIPSMAELLLPTPKGVKEGSIALFGVKEGSEVLVDGQLRGTVPMPRIAQVPIGAHEVQVVCEGYVPVSKWVVVNPGQTTAVSLAQEPVASTPIYGTWWFWTATGAAVVGAAIATSVAITANGDAEPQTGVQVSVNADSAFGGR